MDDETLTHRLGEILGRVPTFAWRPGENDPAPTPREVAVMYGKLRDAPDRGIGISVYNSLDEPDVLKRRVQFHIRGERLQPFGADRIAGVVFAVLEGRLRGGGISSIVRQSFTRLGADANGREQRTENYLITLDNLEALL
ncbi:MULTISPECIES: minor capsid protein [Microbacterium]|uniref:minor capsid protein n=1 Tax=Microbacterium TaxID=33882 RepID=UPI001F2A6778|nr:minor capsid protein [Microbacterium sp. str. 'China']